MWDESSSNNFGYFVVIDVSVWSGMKKILEQELNDWSMIKKVELTNLVYRILQSFVSAGSITNKQLIYSVIGLFQALYTYLSSFFLAL